MISKRWFSLLNVQSPCVTCLQSSEHVASASSTQAETIVLALLALGAARSMTTPGEFSSSLCFLRPVCVTSSLVGNSMRTHARATLTASPRFRRSMGHWRQRHDELRSYLSSVAASFSGDEFSNQFPRPTDQTDAVPIFLQICFPAMAYSHIYNL